MPNTVRAFISSTFIDLVEHRAAVRKVLEMMSISNLAMEVSVSDDRAPLKKCLDDVRAANIYIGIFAHRYGFVPLGEERSITELEYREAGVVGIDRLIFLLKEGVPWNTQHIDAHIKENANGERIQALRDELAQSKTVNFFSTPDDLASKVAASVHAWHNQQVEKAIGASVKPARSISQPLLDYLLLCENDAEDFHAHYIPLTGTVIKRQPSLLHLASKGIWPPSFRLLADVQQAVDQGPFSDEVGKLLLSGENANRFILSAEAGAGKTVLLQWLRVHLATMLLGTARGRVPLYINLPEWPTSIADFRSLIVHERTASGCPVVAEKDLFLLLDGLDELSPDRRLSCTSAITRWLDVHQETSIVVAIRKTASREAYPFRASVLEIQPMDRDQIAHFIRKRVAPERSDELLHHIFPERAPENERLAFLAKSPFSLALLCAVFDNTRGELPTSLGQLLHHLVAALYQREVDAGIAPAAKFEAFLDSLGKVAFGLFGGHIRTIVHVDWARKRLGDAQSFDLIHQVGLATSLLKARKNERVMFFSHSIYQRYFLTLYIHGHREAFNETLSVVSKSEIANFQTHLIETIHLLLDLEDQDKVLIALSEYNPCLALVIINELPAKQPISSSTVSVLIAKLLIFFNDRKVDQIIVERYVTIISRLFPDNLATLLLSTNPAFRRATLRALANALTPEFVAMIIASLEDSNRGVRREARTLLQARLKDRHQNFEEKIQEGLLHMPEHKRHGAALLLLNAMDADRELSSRLVAVGGISKSEYHAIFGKNTHVPSGGVLWLEDTLLDARNMVLERRNRLASRQERRDAGAVEETFNKGEAGLVDQTDPLADGDPLSDLIDRLGRGDTPEARIVIRKLRHKGVEVCPVLIGLLKSNNARWKRRVPRVLAGLRYVAAIPDIIDLLEDYDVRVLRDAIIALASLGDASIVWIFEEFVYHPDAAVAANAFRGLREIGGEEAVGIAWKFVEDARPDVRQWAFAVLELHDPVGVAEQIWRFLRDEHNELRRQALNWFMARSPPEAFRATFVLLHENVGVAIPVLHPLGDALVCLGAPPISAREALKTEFDAETKSKIRSFSVDNFQYICGCFVDAHAWETSPAILENIAIVFCRFLEWMGRFDEYLSSLQNSDVARRHHGEQQISGSVAAAPPHH